MKLKLKDSYDHGNHGGGGGQKVGIQQFILQVDQLLYTSIMYIFTVVLKKRHFL